MLDCTAAAAAADQLNCMDRSRGFSGHQFEEQPHLVQRPIEWTRNCFSCGQPGHVARECTRGHFARNLGIHVGFFGRAYPQGWLNPALRPLPLHSREPEFLINREDGSQPWQQQVPRDFQEARGLAGRNLSFMQNRVVDRARDRRSGWADSGTQSHLSGCPRPSEETYASALKKNNINKQPPPVRRPIASKRSCGHRKELEGNDTLLRAFTNCSTSACDDRRGPNSEAASGSLAENSHGKSGNRGQKDWGGDPERRNSESGTCSPDLHVGDFRDGQSGNTSAIHSERAGNRYQEVLPEPYGSCGMSAPVVMVDRLDSADDLENGEISREDNADHDLSAASRGLQLDMDKGDIVSSAHALDDGKNQPSHHESPTEKVFYNDKKLDEEKTASLPADVHVVRPKSEIKDKQETWLRSDSNSSVRASLNDNGRNMCLERKVDGEDREGSEWFSSKRDLDQVGNASVCKCVSHSNSSCAGFPYCNEASNRVGEVNSWQDMDRDQPACSDMVNSLHHYQVLEGDMQTCNSKLERENPQYHTSGIRETMSAATNPQPTGGSQPLFGRGFTSGPVAHHNTSMVWRGKNSRGWGSGHVSIEELAILRSGNPGCVGNSGTRGALSRLSGFSDPKEWQVESEDMERTIVNKERLMSEHVDCLQTNGMQESGLQHNGAIPMFQPDMGAHVLNGCGGFPTIGSQKLDPSLLKNIDHIERNRLQSDGVQTGVFEKHYNIDARVEKLMSKFPLVQGREQDSVADALMAASQQVSEDEFEGESEGFESVPQISIEVHHVENKSETPAELQVPDVSADIPLTPPVAVKLSSQISNPHCWKFPTAGGDWRLTQTERADTTGLVVGRLASWRKEVMNRGVSLCEIKTRGLSDPRKQPHGAVLQQLPKLDIPGWARGCVDKIDNALDEKPAPYPQLSGTLPGRSGPLLNSQLSIPDSSTTTGLVITPRSSRALASGANVTSGTLGNQVKEAGKPTKVRKPGQSRSSGHKPESSIIHRKTILAAEQTMGTITSKALLPGAAGSNHVLDNQNNRAVSQKSGEQLTSLPPLAGQNIAGDQQNIASYRSRAVSHTSKWSRNSSSVVLRRHELQLETGFWHYVDAAGHERGPFLMSALQALVAEGRLPDGASVFRKTDNIWVPVSHLMSCYQASALPLASSGMPGSCSSHFSEETDCSPSEPLPPSVLSRVSEALAFKELYTATSMLGGNSPLFHEEHPQFLGYTNGKLHELVMRSSRGTFPGFLNDALTMWLLTRKSVTEGAGMALVSTPDDTPIAASPVANVMVGGGSTFMEPSAGSRKVAVKMCNEGKQARVSAKYQETIIEAQVKDDNCDFDGIGKRNLRMTGLTKPSGTSLLGIRDVSSPIDHSLSFVTDADQVLSQQFPGQSPVSSQAFDTESPCNLKSSKSRNEVAADSAPLGSVTETVSSNVDGSPSIAEHDSWGGGGRHAEDAQLCKRRLLQLSTVELDGSNSSTTSQVATYATMTVSTETKAREGSSDQEISKTAAMDSMELDVDRPGMLRNGLRQEGWAGLSSRVLRMIFRLLCGDPKSLAAAMATCQSWKECAQKIKVSARHVDLSGLGSHCTDAILNSLLGYGNGDLKRITLDYCTNVSSEGLGILLKSYPAILEVQINGCTQLRELVNLYPKIRWLGNPWASKSSGGPIPRKLGHHKVKNRKRTGERQEAEHGFDGYSGCSLDENGYPDKSAEERESPGTERTLVDILGPLGAEMRQVGSGQSREAKRIKVNSGKGSQSGFGSGITKYPEQQKTGINDEKGIRTKVSRDEYSMKRKVKSRLAYKKQANLTHPSKKSTSMSRKPETPGKELTRSPKHAEKDLEKALAAALKTVMEADSDQVFFRLANEQVPDGRGASSKTAQMDFNTVQKKLKMGLYGGKDGTRTFKEDLFQPLRNAFRLEHDSPMYKAAGRIFKVAHQVGRQLDDSLASPQWNVPVPGQNRALGSCTKSRGAKYSVERQQGTKRTWDLAAGNGRVRGKVLSINNRADGVVGCGDFDIEGTFERDRDRESRHVRMRRNRWSESEAESSDEEDADEALTDEPEEEDSETSGSDVASKSEVADEAMEDNWEETESDDAYSGLGGEGSSRDWWGARMTKAAMVPPLTRKYEVVEEYRIVDDIERVALKMKMVLPDDYEEKLRAAKEKGGDRYAHLDVPELKESKPRKRLGEEVVEQEVYGIDPFTYNLLLNTMPQDAHGFTDRQKQLFIEEKLLRVLNKEVSGFTGSGKAPMEYSLEKVISHIISDAHGDQALEVFCATLLRNMKTRMSDKYVAYRKGLGVVCNKQGGFDEGDFVVEFFGEVYPPWRWYEKQDGIRSLQKKDKDPAPEFYNIVFERPKGDSLGYDVLVVDAMHKANFASRLCHSCRPNCEAKVTAVNGKYMIGVYTLRKIEFGEELTFDYCCVTESKEEHDSSVCLCGSQGCKGSYLCYTGPGAYDEVLKECHGILDRHNLLLQACTSGAVTAREMEELKQAGLGACVLDGLPHWVIKYAAGIVSYLNFERQRLPEELMKAERAKHTGIEIDRLDIEVQTEGVYNQRLQNLAITLDKVRHILARLYDQASKAPPPLRMLEPHELVEFIWKGKDSVVSELLQCMAVHAPEGLGDLTKQIREHNPPSGGDIEGNLRKSLIWLRDTLRKVPATCMGRHDAAADLIHLYAYTKYFFTNYDYGLVESEPLLIYACDLGPKHQGSGPFKWHKSYSKSYVWGQLISWFRQTSADPGASLVQDRRGCLMLPDVSSCYARTIQHDFRCGYSEKDRKKMIFHMENQPQKKWTRKFTPELWNFKSERGLYGSPMLDAVVSKTKLDKECINWLKNRDTVFRGPWDEE